eukprot:XP_020407943.1 vegetative cell wall protein gp1-like [Zea mays]
MGDVLRYRSRIDAESEWMMAAGNAVFAALVQPPPREAHPSLPGRLPGAHPTALRFAFHPAPPPSRRSPPPLPAPPALPITSLRRPPAVCCPSPRLQLRPPTQPSPPRHLLPSPRRRLPLHSAAAGRLGRAPAPPAASIAAPLARSTRHERDEIRSGSAARRIAGGRVMPVTDHQRSPSPPSPSRRHRAVGHARPDGRPGHAAASRPRAPPHLPDARTAPEAVPRGAANPRAAAGRTRPHARGRLRPRRPWRTVPTPPCGAVPGSRRPRSALGPRNACSISSAHHPPLQPPAPSHPRPPAVRLGAARPYGPWCRAQPRPLHPRQAAVPPSRGPRAGARAPNDRGRRRREQLHQRGDAGAAERRQHAPLVPAQRPLLSCAPCARRPPHRAGHLLDRAGTN